MFAKPAFLLRSLFVAATLASLVACSFDGQQPEDEKGSTSALHTGHSSADAGSSKGGKSTGADAGAYDDNDASADVDAGPWSGADAGAGWGDDDDVDAGWDGDDDDGHLGLDDAGAGHWGTDAGF
jgi:hypothetical protein